MERTVDVATGESVVFTYELAGLGSRFIAVLVDLAIQIFILIAALLLLGWIASTVPDTANVKLGPNEKVATAILLALASVFVFLLFFGYFIFFEWRFNGRTPGKRLVGIRVVRDGGFPLDFTAATNRNVVRILEFSFGFYIISAVSTLLSPMNRRLGDFAAGTIVVRDGRYERTAAPPYRDRPDDTVIAALSPAERTLIRSYAARRSTLGASARVELAARIAGGIRPKLGASFAHLSDDDLLVHLATTAL